MTPDVGFYELGRSVYERLTEKQKRMFHLLSGVQSIGEIAHIMGLQYGSARNLADRIYDSLGLNYGQANRYWLIHLGAYLGVHADAD